MGNTWVYSTFFMGIMALIGGWFFGGNVHQDVPETIYGFRMKTVEGADIDFEQFRGKYILIVNTASKCGYTPQYADLQKFHELYGDRVKVLGFPANDFLWQEPGTNQEIEAFCKKNYGVTFPLSEKISVKGRNRHPLYQWLVAKSGKAPSWNFCKYLIGPDGEVLGFYPSKTKPMDPSILSKILP